MWKAHNTNKPEEKNVRFLFVYLFGKQSNARIKVTVHVWKVSFCFVGKFCHCHMVKAAAHRIAFRFVERDGIKWKKKIIPAWTNMFSCSFHLAVVVTQFVCLFVCINVAYWVGAGCLTELIRNGVYTPG